LRALLGLLVFVPISILEAERECAESSELGNVMPCLRAELVTMVSNFRIPSAPSLLLQYSRPFEVLMGRRRTTYMVADGLVHGPDGGDGLVHQDRFV